MKHIHILIMGLLSLAPALAAQKPVAGIEIEINQQTITWVQSVPPSAVAKPQSSNVDDLKRMQLGQQTHQLNFSNIPKGYLGIGHNAASNSYGFISEEVVVTFQQGSAQQLQATNARCKLILENAQMYVCKATSVPHLKTLIGQLQAMPSVKSVSPRFVTRFNQPM